MLQAIAPFYIIGGTELCYRCKKETPVICFAAEGYQEDNTKYQQFTVFDNVTNAHPRLLQFFREKKPHFRLNNSAMAGMRYFMNHCHHCNAKLGDFFLHHEPDGCFYGLSRNDVKRALRNKTAHILISNGSISVEAECHGEMITRETDHQITGSATDYMMKHLHL